MTDAVAAKRMEGRKGDAKRDREPHLVKLRKDKRDQELKRKRQEMAQGAQPAQQPTQDLKQEQHQLPTGLDPANLTIDQALQYYQENKPDFEWFITNIAAKMKFQVSTQNYIVDNQFLSEIL